ncbi:MAG: hypothetical protein ABSA59_00630 [Terriglobia bacterium]
MPNSVLDGSSIAPKASPREKRDAADSPDSTSMAGILFNAFVADITQPAPTVALSTEAPESTVSLQSPAAESTPDSPLKFDSGLNTLAAETSANIGTLPIPAVTGAVAAPGALSAWASKGVGLTGTAKAEASRSTVRERGQGAIHSSGLVPTTGQNPTEDTSTPQPVSAPAWFPLLQDTSHLSQFVEPQVGGSLSESKQVRASNPVSAQESETRQASLDSPSFTDSWPKLEQLDPAQMQAAPPPMSQDWQAASHPSLASGQTEQTAPGSGPEASDSSTPFSAIDHPALAEFSSLLGKFAGADWQAASHLTLSSGQTEQAVPASRSEASVSSTSFSAADHPALAEFSSLLGKFAGADWQAASHPTLSLGQTEQAAPGSGPEASDPSTSFSATDHPALAEFSSLLGKFAGADWQAASHPTLSLAQTEQAAPASRPEASDSSTPFSATDHPALAEFSSLLGKFAGADWQAASHPTLSSGQTEQAAPASSPEASDSSTLFSTTDHPPLGPEASDPSTLFSTTDHPPLGPEASDPSTPFSATDHPALAEFSSVLGKFAGADWQAASNSTLSLAQTEQAAPASGPEASDSSRLFSTTDHPDLAEFSSVLGKVAGADWQAASNSTLSLAQTEQAAPASGPEASDSSTLFSKTDHPPLGPGASDTSTPVSATDHPALAEFSSVLGKVAGTDWHAASNSTLSLAQTEQAAPPSGPEASDSSRLFSTTDHPDLAEFSSVLGKFAAADWQAASHPTLSLGQTEQAAPASGPEASDPSTPFSATDHPALAKFSSVLGKFAGADVPAASNPPLSTGQMGQAAPAFGP